MNIDNLKIPILENPSMLFVGVTTGKSFINKLFPLWAEILGLETRKLVGIDIPVNADPEIYRETARFFRNEPNALGALVTTHKVNLYQSARDLFDRFDPYAQKLDEISSISKQDNFLIGHAKDPITSGKALERIFPLNYWDTHNDAEALILGSGGSALALTCYFLERPEYQWPAKIHLTGRTLTRLEHLKDVLSELSGHDRVHIHHVTDLELHKRLLENLPEGSLVVNATGMGKDRPGSPLPDSARFPKQAIVWEFNYRGTLEFLHQAKAQQAAQSLLVEDGWIYFLYGWAYVIAEVFHFALHDELFNKLEQKANAIREEKD